MTEKPPGREVAYIYWDGEEVAGVTFYALFDGGDTPGVEFPADLWAHPIEVRRGRLFGEGWQVLLWDVQLPRWPSSAEWHASVRATLDRLRAAGAVVAWIGLEGGFCDPPSLFDPTCMPASVLAAAAGGVLFDPFDPDEPMATITDDELLQLRAASQGLAELGGDE